MATINPPATPITSRGGLNRFLGFWGIWILALFALLYYGSYYRAGLYPASEGGVEGMVALRLMEGARPIVDTFLGYNLLWFYPVVGLFKLFGPSFIVLRIFFYTLSTLTGFMSFRLVRKCTDSGALAFLAGLLVILIPGQMFRNYMAFIVVLNLSVFLSAYVLPARLGVRLFWMASSGITLAVAWLIRVDVGCFLTCIALGLTLIYPLGELGKFSGGLLKHIFSRAGVAILGLLLAVLLFTLVHLPFYQDASRRGFDREFVAQYDQWPRMIEFQGERLLDSARASAREILGKFDSEHAAHAVPISPAPTAKPSTAPPSNATLYGTKESSARGATVTEPQLQKAQISQTTMARSSFMAATARDRMLALNLHLPILAAGLLALGAIAGWLIGLFWRSEQVAERSLILLTALGCSLTLFPQYFFWRPDMVHLSEFMVPMTLTLLLGCFMALRDWKFASVLLRLGLALFLLVATGTLLLYYINACQSQASGGIAVSLNKRLEFHAAHGVDVKLTPTEYADASAIQRIITSASVPGEYVICYPYNPEINFMTDRPSYEYNFYVDNAMVAPDRFYKETVENIISYRPVVFVITNWEINNTEESEFKNWASQTYNYIAQNYKLAYQRGNLEVFVRPDRMGLIPKSVR